MFGAGKACLKVLGIILAAGVLFGFGRLTSAPAVSASPAYAAQSTEATNGTATEMTSGASLPDESPPFVGRWQVGAEEWYFGADHTFQRTAGAMSSPVGQWRSEGDGKITGSFYPDDPKSWKELGLEVSGDTLTISYEGQVGRILHRPD